MPKNEQCRVETKTIGKHGRAGAVHAYNEYWANFFHARTVQSHARSILNHLLKYKHEMLIAARSSTTFSGQCKTPIT